MEVLAQIETNMCVSVTVGESEQPSDSSDKKTMVSGVLTLKWSLRLRRRHRMSGD